MKFRPFFVTVCALIVLSAVGCGPAKETKQAANEGNALIAESNAINSDLGKTHNVYTLTSAADDGKVVAYISIFPWDRVSVSDRATIRTKLTTLIAKIDRIFKIDRRKDIKVKDSDGGLQRMHKNATAYLNALNEFERKSLLDGGSTKAGEKRASIL